MSDQTKISEEFAEAAAGEALSSLTAEESAAYAGRLAAGSADEQRLDRALRETVARLSGAAPYMKPREELRGRILAATAPATFRMEDYRKANRDTGRFYKWGFYAAMAFLAAGAWYNVSLQNRLGAVQTAAIKTIDQMGDVIKQRESAIESIVNPHTQQVSIQTEKGKIAGRAFLNPVEKNAVVILPEGMLPPNQAPQLIIKDSAGKVLQIPTQYVQVAPSAFPDIVPTRLQNPDQFAIKNVQPDPQAPQPRVAVMGQ